jgi:hypothetical protein
MNLILDQSPPPLPSPIIDPPALQQGDNPPSTIEMPPYAVAFVLQPAAQPYRYSVGGDSIGGVGSGSLQPAMERTGRLGNPVDGRFSVADIKPGGHNTTAQPSGTLSVPRRVVDPSGNTSDSYSSLASALIDAEDGTILELKWNNAKQFIEPIQLDRRKLQFVAAQGFNPILLFEPTEELYNARSFFTVLSSDLEFRQVAIELRLNPNVLSPHWSLFELTGNSRLTFERCCLTVRNKSTVDDSAHHDDVVFFRNDPFAEEASLTENMISEPLTIELTDSLLRGEAIAVQSNVPQDIHITLTNSLVALAKPFIHVEENRRTGRQTTIQIRWDTVAFFGRHGVASLTTVEPMNVDFESQRSVYVLYRSPFAVFNRDNFRWSGTGNYFQGVEEWKPDTDEQTKIDILDVSKVDKAMSRYLPRDVRLHNPVGSDPIPDFGWFPAQWLSE